MAFSQRARACLAGRVVEIIALGLRKLAPYNFVPIYMPFIEFDVGDRAHANVTKSTSASKKPTGSNPNFIEQIRIPMKLPVNALFAPALNMRVRDTRLGGFSKPTIGTCAVPLSQKIPWSADYHPDGHRAVAADDPFAEEVRLCGLWLAVLTTAPSPFYLRVWRSAWLCAY